MTDNERNEMRLAARRTELLMNERLERRPPYEVSPGIWVLPNGCHAFTLAAIRCVMVNADDAGLMPLPPSRIGGIIEAQEILLLAAALDGEKVTG